MSSCTPPLVWTRDPHGTSHWSRSHQSSPLKLIFGHAFTHLLGNTLQLLRQGLLVPSSLDRSQLVRTATSCVPQRILEYPLIALFLQACVSLHCTRLELTQLIAVGTRCTILDRTRLCRRTCTPSVSSRLDSLGIRVLVIADVGRLDAQIVEQHAINHVQPHLVQCSATAPVPRPSVSFPTRLTHSRHPRLRLFPHDAVLR